jgi:sarcosine oxidase delta subunit
MTEPYRVTKQAVSTMTSESMTHDIIDRLAELAGGRTAEEYKAVWLAGLPRIFSMTGEQAEQEFIYDNERDRRPITREVTGLVSYVYCLESLRATERGQAHEAWIYQSFAQHWLGVTVGSQTADGAVDLADAIRNKNAADKRHAPKRAMIAKAKQLAAKCNYANASKAADGVLDEILAIGEAEQVEGYCEKEIDEVDWNVSLRARVRRKIYLALLEMKFEDKPR